MITKIDITEEMIKNATFKATAMGNLNNSILKGEGNLIGFLGEQIALSVLGGVGKNTYDYDLVTPNGTKVDVKTKKTTVEPKPFYDCSVAAFNIKQKCNLYCFVRVKDDYTCGWFLGVYPKEDYFKDAVFLRKGDLDPSNKYTVKADCYNLKISSLKNVV
jgi:hypothetical protein